MAQEVEGLGAVVGDSQAGGQAVDPVRPLRIDADVGVVERPLAGRLVGVGGLPGAAAVLGAQHHVVALRLHQGVDDPRLGGRDGEADAAEVALRQAVVLGQPLPAVAAVVGDVEPRARPAGAEEPGPAPVVPQCGEELVRVGGVHHQLGAAAALVGVEDALPGLAAVGGPEDAALGVLAPLLALGGDVGDVGVGGMQDDAADALGLVEPQVMPGAAGVERAVDAVADRSAVARVAFAGAHPDDVRVAPEDRDGADRRHRLVVEDRLEGQAAVGRLPDAAGRAPDVDHLGVRFHRRDGDDAAAHRRRSDRARLHPRQQGGIDGRGLPALGPVRRLGVRFLGRRRLAGGGERAGQQAGDEGGEGETERQRLSTHGSLQESHR